MAVAKLVTHAAVEVRTRIANRAAEITTLEQNLQALKDQKAKDEADLAELETAIPAVKAVAAELETAIPAVKAVAAELEP